MVNEEFYMSLFDINRRNLTSNWLNKEIARLLSTYLSNNASLDPYGIIDSYPLKNRYK